MDGRVGRRWVGGSVDAGKAGRTCRRRYDHPCDQHSWTSSCLLIPGQRLHKIEMRAPRVVRSVTRGLSSLARVGGMDLRRRVCLSISSWFCVPEEGMKDMDILCRSSAFVLPVQNKEKFSEKSFHLVTCSHVVAPWKWPNYYPAEWLRAVNETHTYYTVELRDGDGVFNVQLDLLPRVYHHPNRDLAVLHIEDEESSIETLSALQFDGLLLDESTYDKQERLFFYGHDVQGPVEEDGTDMRVPIPCDCEGRFEFSTPRQTFAKTARVLTDGMCGGPVCGASSSSVSNKRIGSLGFSDKFLARGMIEGIIPEDHSDESLQGLAAFIEASEITTFLDSIEDGQVEPLQGGQSAIAVGKDQDPEKMTFEYVAKHDEPHKDSDLSPRRRAELEMMKKKAKELLQKYSDEPSSRGPSRNRDRKSKRERE